LIQFICQALAQYTVYITTTKTVWQEEKGIEAALTSVVKN